jgi:hypothetical protein
MGAELDSTPLMTYFCAQPCLAVKGVANCVWGVDGRFPLPVGLVGIAGTLSSMAGFEKQSSVS